MSFYQEVRTTLLKAPFVCLFFFFMSKPQEGPGCASSPCLNGGKCISTCYNVPVSYRCECDEPHFGDLCQNWKGKH